jgi:hypothetical protein
VVIYSFFEERNKEGYVLSFGANERTKENIHPHQASPYMSPLKKSIMLNGLTVEHY